MDIACYPQRTQSYRNLNTKLAKHCYVMKFKVSNKYLLLINS